MNLSIVPKFLSTSRISKSILIGAVSLGFAAMAPATFAQRGGGGHVGGGGAHVSGGGFHPAGMSGGVRPAGNVGGGERGSVGSGPHFGTAAHAPGVAGPYAPSSSSRGYTRQFFVAAPARGGVSTRFVGAGPGTSAGTHTFAAGNHLWEAPPQPGREAVAPRPVFMPRPGSGRSAVLHGFVGMTSTPFRGPRFGHVPFHPGFHPIGPNPCTMRFGNCSFFNPPFFNNPFFFGFGFNSCFASGFGCFGFGNFGAFDDFGMGLFGYGNGWFYPPAPEPPPAPENLTQENQAPNYAPDYYFEPPADEAAAAPAQSQKPVVKLVLKDGTIFGVYSYWLQNNQLFYITTYNIKTSIPIDDLDLQKTVDLNQKLGVTFSLSSKPPDQQQPPDERQ